MNLQEELKALKERIAELEELTKEEVEFPQDGDDYWFIDETGGLFYGNWDDYSFEKDMLSIGNVFKTEEQAQFAVEKLKVEAELRKFSRPFKSFKPNFHIALNDRKELIVDNWSTMCYQGAIYFESEEKTEQAIKSVGEHRIKKYIFGVED